MDDGRKPPFFEDRDNAPQRHVNFPTRTPEEMRASMEAHKLRMGWEHEQKPALSPNRSEAKTPKVESDDKPPPRAEKLTHTFNPYPGMGPTIAGVPGAPKAKDFARVSNPDDRPKADAEPFKAEMAAPKPEPAAPEPARPGAPIVSRRPENRTWAELREARSFPLTNRPAALQAFEKDMSPETRRRYEDAGKYERPADRLLTGRER